MLALMTMTVAHARTYTINVSASQRDLTQYLRDKCKTATRNDTVVLNFGKGEYTIDGTVQFKCSAVIKGAGRDQSTIILNNGSDKNGFKAFTDDTFFKFYGSLEAPISTTISDITFRLKDHKGIWWKDGKKTMPKHAVKIYHANRVNISRVNSYMSHAVITNFDLRVCSNVSVTDCIISNFNSCEEGGNLWFRGITNNASVKRNKFYKYGNDEVFGVFGSETEINSKGVIKGNVSRTDIVVEDNEFHYGYNGKDKIADVVNNTLLTLESSEGNKWLTNTRNFSVKNNKFYINDECTRCFLVRLFNTDSHQGIVYDGNQIVNENLHSDKKYYRYDFDIHDLSKGQDSIRIINNVVTNNNSVLNPSNVIGYSFLLLRGGNVSMRSNKIVSMVTSDPYTGKDSGVQLVCCAEEGGTVTMSNNVCKGVMCIATIGAGNGTKKFTLNAFNNYFTGDTRVYCHKVNQLDIKFVNNTLVSNNTNFFLQEFATKGSVVFNNNDVTVSSGDGRFMTHYSNASTNEMKFEKLEMKNNVFRGVKGESDMLKKITNLKKKRLSANKYGR